MGSQWRLGQPLHDVQPVLAAVSRGRGLSKTDYSDAVPVNVITFGQVVVCELAAEPRDESWTPLKAMPDGAHAVGAVNIALESFVDKGRPAGSSGRARNCVNRVSQRIRGTFSDAFAAMTQSWLRTRVVIARPVGAPRSRLRWNTEWRQTRVKDGVRRDDGQAPTENATR